jgi:predicted PurR-regulated permease PerM
VIGLAALPPGAGLGPASKPTFDPVANGNGEAAADGRMRVQLEVPARTIAKILLALLITWATLKLWPEFIFLLISVLLAVSLTPGVRWLQARGLPRGAAVVVVAVATMLVVGAVAAFVLPPLGEELMKLFGNYPAFRARAERRLPAEYPFLKRVATEALALPSSPEVAAWANRPLLWGQAAVAGAMRALFVLVLTFYLMADGRRLYAWMLAFVPRGHREKMAQTIPEISQVLYGYVRGQVITSVLFALFAAIVLHLLHVPAVVPLAVLAAICDIIPVLGIIITIFPTALLAMTVSPAAAGTVVCLFVGYHVFEAYYIAPRIYGKQLRLSTLAVLLALVVGGTLQGVLGAILVLPVFAAYPIIERIWLADKLPARVLRDHTALADALESGNDDAVDAVLDGPRPEQR